MNKRAWCVVAVVVLLVGCSKKDEPNVAAQTNSAASGNPLTAPVDYLGAAAKAKQVSEKTIEITSLSQAIQLFYAQEDRFPKDLDELVAKRYLSSIPPAPGGGKWAYNPQTGDIKIVQ